MKIFSKKSLSCMSSDEFIKNLYMYKNLKDKNYKPKKWPIIKDLLLICSSTIFLRLLDTIILNTVSFKTYIAILPYLFSVVATLTVIQLILAFYIIVTLKDRVLKHDDLFRTKTNIENSLFKGDLDEIFNKECDATQKIINKNKEKLIDDVCENKALSGKIILDLFMQIEKEKIKEKEMEVMISCNTRTGKMLKDINEFSL